MVDWTRAEDRSGEPVDCRRCRHSEVDPVFTVVELVVCTSTRIGRLPNQPAQACSIARSPAGRCGPGARFIDIVSSSPR